MIVIPHPEHYCKIQMPVIIGHLNATMRVVAILLLFQLFFFNSKILLAQSADDYEEISVFLNVQGIGGYEITAIYKDDQIYLPVPELFRCLKINQKISEENDTISGFFLVENNKYLISFPSQTVFINGKLLQLNKDEIFNTEGTGIVLKIDQFGKIFGLDCKFNFSSLSVELKTSHELPVIKELRLEQMRKNISRLRGEITVDTTYERNYHFLRGGMVDWAIYSTQVSKGTTETRAMLGLGAEVLGGETNIELNYSSRNNFEKRQQQYHWRWANNKTKLVKQITVGKISSRSIASIYSPLIGTVISNTPTSYRRSFGTYTMTDFTEPGWTVELYINNVIVDYATADASGFFKFDIPLVYGASNVVLKFYGPWGEERLKEQVINVPYNFLPPGEFQYSIAGAVVQDTSHSVFTRGEANYGITRHLTLGGGFEYLSSVNSSPSIPFVTGSAQIFNNFLFNGEYAYGVRTKALFSYSLPSNFVFDIDYTKYAHEQKAITFNYLEERKIRVSVPITIRSLKAYTRLAYIQNKLIGTTYSTTEATFSTFYKGVSVNFTGNANWLGKYKPYVYGNFALGFRFFKSLSFRPQVQYDFSNNKLIYTKVELENNFSPKCNLALAWENNIRSNYNSVELTLRYDFSFAQTSINTRVSDKYIMTGQNARGSFAFGSGNGRVIVDKRSQLGRAGLTIIPFLDINDNNHREENEPITAGMKMRINGGRVLPDLQDSIVRVLDLEPFVSYLLEFSDTQFDNIAWQIQNKTMSILMDPNQFKLLEIPIKVMGEINGIIYMKTGNKTRVQGRIQLNIFNTDGKFIAKTQSESDGYFTFIGLAPGSYYAQIDSAQLSKLKALSQPDRFNFEIFPSENGDIIDNVEFTLLKESNDIQGGLIPEQKTEINETNDIPSVPSSVLLNKEEKQNTKSISITTTPSNSNISPASHSKTDLIRKSETNTNTVHNPNTKVTPQSNTNNTVSILSDSHIEVLASTDNKLFFIQAGAYSQRGNAEKEARQLHISTSKKWMVITESGFFKVRLGYFSSRKEAQEVINSMKLTGKTFYINK